MQLKSLPKFAWKTNNIPIGKSMLRLVNEYSLNQTPNKESKLQKLKISMADRDFIIYSDISVTNLKMFFPKIWLVFNENFGSDVNRDVTLMVPR